MVLELGTLRKVDQKYLQSFEMWLWRRTEIRWTDNVKKKMKYYIQSRREGISYVK